MRTTDRSEADLRDAAWAVGVAVDELDRLELAVPLSGQATRVASGDSWPGS